MEMQNADDLYPPPIACQAMSNTTAVIFDDGTVEHFFWAYDVALAVLFAHTIRIADRVPTSARCAGHDQLVAPEPGRCAVFSRLSTTPSRAVHSIRPVDTNGRVVDKAVVGALDWRPGDLLSWRVTGGLVLIARPGHGRRGITKYGHLSLPAAVRHSAGIRIHDRVLLAADPGQALLVVYPADVLDDILARRFAEGAPQ